MRLHWAAADRSRCGAGVEGQGYCVAWIRRYVGGRVRRYGRRSGSCGRGASWSPLAAATPRGTFWRKTKASHSFATASRVLIASESV